jgi:hypothetical protein
LIVSVADTVTESTELPVSFWTTLRLADGMLWGGADPADPDVVMTNHSTIRHRPFLTRDKEGFIVSQST